MSSLNMYFWKNKGFLAAIGAVFAIVCCMITLSQLTYRTIAQEILRQGRTTPGTVTSLSARPAWADSPEMRGRRYFVTVRFPDAQGRMQENIAWQYIGWQDARHLQVGDPVEVVYLPSRTYTPYLKPSLTRLASSGWVAGLSGLGAVMGITAAVWALLLKPRHKESDMEDTLPTTD